MGKRRTRRDRDGAQLRRQKLVEASEGETGLSYSVAIASLAKVETEKEKEVTGNWVKKDLKKTVWVTGLALSLEVCAYWLVELGGLERLTGLFSIR